LRERLPTSSDRQLANIEHVMLDKHDQRERRLPSPNFGCATVADDVVFTSTYDGVVYAFATSDGSMLWHTRMRAGVNACLAIAGDSLLVGAGIRRPNGDAPELVAFGLDG
jgi:outer membrane protein assembly factor BamB